MFNIDTLDIFAREKGFPDVYKMDLASAFAASSSPKQFQEGRSLEPM